MTTEKSVGILPFPQVHSTISPSTSLIIEELGLDLVTDESSVATLLNLVLPDYKIHDWGLPGHGKSKNSCGSFYRKICLNTFKHPDNKAVFKNMVHSCHKPTCPICWNSWALRESDRISFRLFKASELHPHLGKPIHVTASVPFSLYHLSFKKLKAKLNSILRKVGFIGGSCILHAFRQYETSGLWYFSPHFHLIGFGWITHVSEIYNKTRWVVKNLGVRNNVFGTAYYQLTHCAVWYGKGKKHSVTWIGELSYNRLKIPKKPSKTVRCPYCGAKMVTAIREKNFNEPLPCNGINGFYLASAEGWTTKEDQFYLSMIPKDWNVKYDTFLDNSMKLS